MAFHSVQPFRFMDLPGEMRNQIYACLLCSFGPSETAFWTSSSSLKLLGHRADTAILLASRQVHREAYDVFRDQESHAGQLWNQGLKNDAAADWLSCLLELARARSSSSWDNLVSLGGNSFVDALIEIRFLSSLDFAQYFTSAFSDAIAAGKFEVTKKAFRNMAEHTFLAAEQCMTVDFWQAGRDWKPSDTLVAKLRYRQAQFMVLERDASQAGSALALITLALRILPNDRKVRECSDAIVEWCKST